ncbi:MAG: hypothetical protein ACRYFX_22220 [Janthinobacterium lividum]
MRLPNSPARCWLGLLAGLAACRPNAPAERLPTAPLLEAVPAGYRPVARQDTLPSYWAPPEASVHNAFAFTPAHLSQVVLRVQLVPASAARRVPLDTLTFHWAGRGYGLGQAGLNWVFDRPPRRLTSALLGERGEAVKVFSARTYPLVIAEEAVDKAGYRYTRNRYTIDYPFCPVAVARLGDSVVYARAFLLQANLPQPETLYAARRNGPAQRLPHAADRLDTTRQVLLRLSLHQLRHSATPAGY